MSLKSKSTTHPGVYIPSTSFSSMSMGSYIKPRTSNATNQALPITAVTVNKSLLTPMNTEIDPMIQTVRNQEKEQIKDLNNQFVSYIDKVRHLEQQNKMLETKWKLLEGNSDSSIIEPMLKTYIASLEKHLELLSTEKQRLTMQNEVMHKNVNDYKTKYEDELEMRNSAEKEFVMIKKDVDAAYLSRADLENKLHSLVGEFGFHQALYNKELLELQESVKQTSVVVQMDNSRVLNMEQIIYDVKAQYEDFATHNREQAENWYKTKFDQMNAEANQYGHELRSSKLEIAELTQSINHLQNETKIIKEQCANLESHINEAEECGDAAIQDAKTRIKDLERALQRAKQDMARQLREYQELMNVKLALDLEISTYRKLLEGEEKMLGQETVFNIQTLPTRNNSRPKLQRQKSVPIVIKTMETNNITYNSK